MRWTVLIGVWIALLAWAAGVARLLAEAAGRSDRLADAAASQTGRTVAFVCGVGLAHAAAGFVCGLVAALLARWAFPRWRRLGPSLCLAGVFAWVVAFDAAMRPVFWEPVLYQTGGLARAAMVFATDVLTPRGLAAAGLAALGVLLGLGALRRRRTGTRPAFRRLALVGATASLVLAVWATRAWDPTDASPLPAAEAATMPPGRYNVIMLGVDSLRADRLAALGGRAEVMPGVNAVAERGVVFSDMFVPLARTLPSVVSLLTGTDPHTHGLRHMFPPRHQRRVRPVTLPACLRAQGYRSEVVTDYAGEMFRLVDLGFDAVHGPPPFSLSSVIRYEVIGRTPGFLPFFNHPPGHGLFPVLRFLPANADPDWLATRIVDRLAALDEADDPFLLMGFFTGCHTPYASRWPGYRTFGDPDYQGANKYAFFARRLEQLGELEERLPDHEVAQIRALYDGTCRLTDEAISRVLREARRRDLWKNTVFVIFADHGEHLYEPGNTSDHGKWFRGDEANRIPLVLAGGPVEAHAGTVDGVARGVDLMPTLLALLGVPRPESVEGVDLGPRIRGEPAARPPFCGETGIWLDAGTTFGGQDDALIYPSIDGLLTVEAGDLLVLRGRYQDDVVRAKHRCLRTDRWKLVYIPTKQGVRYELYDVASDPANLTDLSAKHPDVVTRLAHELRRWMERDPARRFDPRGHMVVPYDYYE